MTIGTVHLTVIQIAVTLWLLGIVPAGMLAAFVGIGATRKDEVERQVDIGTVAIGWPLIAVALISATVLIGPILLVGWIASKATEHR